jgi:hypothetical protein
MPPLELASNFDQTNIAIGTRCSDAYTAKRAALAAGRPLPILPQSFYLLRPSGRKSALHFRAAFRAEPGAAFNLSTAFHAEFLALDGLAAFRAELCARCDTRPAVGAAAHHGLLEFFFSNIGGFLRRLARLLHCRIRLYR